MIKLRAKRFLRSNSKLSNGEVEATTRDEIKWEMRPGGMLVQKRVSEERDGGEALITIKVSILTQCHAITTRATSTFGELKTILAMVTALEPKEQRILFKGKEREDCEYLHMVGVRDNDKVLLLEDPAIKERKLLNLTRGHKNNIGITYRTIRV